MLNGCWKRLYNKRNSVQATAVRVAVITNVVPSYRLDFYRRLFEFDDLEVTVFSHATAGSSNLSLVHERLGQRWVEVRYVGMESEKLGFQLLPIRRLLSAFDVYVVYGNPRILSNVLLSIGLRILGRRVVVWGQGKTFSGSGLMERLRLMWWRLMTGVLVYTEMRAEIVSRALSARVPVWSINNGLATEQIVAHRARWSADDLRAWRIQNGTEGRRIVLSVARLVPKNRFDLGLLAVAELCKTEPEMLWVIIGTGPEERALKDGAKHLNIAHCVKWLGEVYSESELAPWFLSARLLLHPGAIGLSLMHAFLYGRPVVTHGNSARQMPEFDVFVDGKSGVLFKEGDLKDLIAKVRFLLQNESSAREMGAFGQSIAMERYNTEVMVERFRQCVLAVSR